ncbi:hypothetical protein LN042_20840 [Kitasatospora sp. RB6PN24]|uniref:hypothetical protein n=1 Tax=Kitasatospora humi TaxID=2893891 RepID=UPI001E52AB1D|nr:hypothetical protein [Kitasatospora humi]MCC9309495.1 hypothetical protein [Kitasatospora humi]
MSQHDTTTPQAPDDSTGTRQRRIRLGVAVTGGATVLVLATGWALAGHTPAHAGSAVAVPGAPTTVSAPAANPTATAPSPSASPASAVPSQSGPAPTPSQPPSPAQTTRATPVASQSLLASSRHTTAPPQPAHTSSHGGVLTPAQAAMIPPGNNDDRPEGNTPQPNCNCTIVLPPTPPGPTCGTPTNPCHIPAIPPTTPHAAPPVAPTPGHS